MNESLTAWDAQEHAGLLAVETEERRDQRRIAEDPDTSAALLTAIARPALEARTTDRFAWFRYLQEQRENAATHEAESEDGSRSWRRAPWRRSELLFQALAAHPHTPPPLLAELIRTAPLIPQVTSAFFRNPAASLLLLDHPGFLEKMDVFCQLLLLREATAIPLFVEWVASNTQVAEKAAQVAAEMHIAVAGEVADNETGHDEMRAAWQGRWGAITPYSLTHQWQANLLPEKAQSPRWTDRIDAATWVDVTDAPMSEDFFNRSGLDMLRHLSCDGNRFVRWTARNRLATSDTK